MDPLSISASIAGLIALTDAVFLGLMKYVRSVKDAAKDIENLAKEINFLGGALHSLSRLAKCFGDEPADNRTFRMYHIEACSDILRTMNKKLDKFDSDKFLSRARWPFSSTRVNELLAELSQHKVNINLALSANSMDLLLRSLANEEELQRTALDLKANAEKTKEIVSRIDRSGEHQKVQRFFLKHNPQQNYEMSLKLRQPRTGLWLLRLPSFQTWLSNPDSKLWLSGIPGAGKTVLAGTIIEASLGQCNDSVAGAFFFCDYKVDITHSPANILAAIAYQVAIQKEDAYKILEKYYRDLHPTYGLEKGYEAAGLERVVRDMVKLFDRVFIVVDGIDECGQQVEDVLERLCTLSEDSDNISMALLSRDEHNIRECLENDFVCEKIAAHTEDITEYVSAQIEKRVRIGKLHIDDLNLKGEIMQGLVDGAAGMFRWVACQLDHLEQCDSDQECRKALKKLPPNLNETYLRILERIPTNKTKLAQLTLNFIAFIGPMLNIEQLREAVSIPETGGFLSPNGLIRERAIQKLCSSLIRKSNDEEHFEFAHFSVQEFLQNQTILLQNQFSQFLISKKQCDRLIAVQCLRYLQLENFNRVPIPAIEERFHVQKRNKSNPLYRFAAYRWFWYASDQWDDAEIVLLAKKLFNPHKTAIFCSWFIDLIHQLVQDRNAIDTRMNVDIITRVNHESFTPLHAACALFLPTICSYLLKEGANINQKSPNGTPIQCATGSLFLIYKNARNHMLYGSYFSIALKGTLAEETVQTLIKAGVDRTMATTASTFPSTFDPNTSPVTLVISLMQHLVWVNFLKLLALLISGGFTLDENDIKAFSRYLKHYDCTDDREILWKKLVAASQSVIGRSPLHWKICSMIWEFAIKHNMKFTSDPNQVDPSISLSRDMQRQHLVQAVKKSDLAAFQKIREASHFNMSDFLDEQGNRLLYIALAGSFQWHPNIQGVFPMVEILLEAGCSFLQPNRDGTLPVHDLLCQAHLGGSIFCKICDEPFVKFLIDHGVTVCSQDNSGRNILHCSYSNPVLLSAFLKYENEVDITHALRMVDNDGYTPLSLALKYGYTRSATLLFERCKSDPEAWRSPTPILQLVAKGDNEDIFRSIFDSGYVSTEVLSNTLTPMHYVGPQTPLNFIKYLQSIYPDACDNRTENGLPLITYLKDIFQGPERYLPPHSPYSEVISALYPKSLENRRSLWEYFVKDVMIYDSKKMTTFEEGLCTKTVKELTRLGCLTQYETAFQRSSVLTLLESKHDNMEGMGDLRPFTIETTIDIINQTKHWSDIQASPSIVQLLKAATRSDSHDMVLLLCQKGVSVHQRVEKYSALEVACREFVADGIFQLLLDHADKDRLDETNPEDHGLGLLHYLAVRDSAGKVAELLRRGANPNLLAENEKKTPVLVHHLLGGQINSALILLNNGADPTFAVSHGIDAHTAAVLRGATDFLVALYQTAAATSKWHVDWQKLFSQTSTTTSGKAIRIDGCNALHLSALSGNVDCVSFYIDRGIFSDVDATTDVLKMTPLHCAAFKGNTSTIKFLIEEGADINARTSSGELPLHYAVLGEHPNAIETLISLGSDMTVVDKWGRNPYTLVYQLDNDYDNDHGNNAPQTCFQESGQCRNSISDDNNVSTQKELGPMGLAIALEGAITDGNTELCQELHQKGCQLDIDLSRCGGCSPLLLAIQENEVEAIEWLLNHEASTLKISCQSHGGLGPIHEILPEEDLNEVLPLFLESYLNDGGNLLREVASPVYSAVRGNNLKGLQILLEHLQKNAKHYADEVGEIEWNRATLLALNQRAANSTMSSTLHLAAEEGYVDVVKYLLENGADVNAKTKDLKTPLHSAISSKANGMSDIIGLLIDHDAELNCRDERGLTPLMNACLEGKWEIVKLLIDAKADLNIKDYESDGLLHQAAFSLNVKMFNKLQSLNLDLYEKDQDGISAIHVAMRNSQLAHLILNGTYDIQETAPFPWGTLYHGEMSWLTDTFFMFQRKLSPGTLKIIANTEPRNAWSPLCLYSSHGNLRIMENLLTLGADIEFEGCPNGTALMVACYAGRLESVTFLVRRGAALSYYGRNGFRTALDGSKTPKRVLKWLLVTRFTDQAKINETADDGSCAEPEVLRSWSGVMKAELVITGYLERRSHQSSKDYWTLLMWVKKKWEGKVVPMVDRRRTIRPSKLIPSENVRIHPGGYEIPKAADPTGI
ncbi:ankyrin [Rostrohypoxylon terebratum]|nr:ankyrin [Rostrohypoxylon terebratum]